MPFELIDPKGLEAPVGYAHAAKITGGAVVHIAGQAPFNEKGEVVGKGDLVTQFTQVMSNLKTAIEGVGGKPNPIEGVGGKPNQYAVLTIYITNLEAYWNNKKPLGTAYRAVFGNYFPAITLVEVKRLYNPDCMIEISGIAVID